MKKKIAVLLGSLASLTSLSAYTESRNVNANYVNFERQNRTYQTRPFVPSESSQAPSTQPTSAPTPKEAPLKQQQAPLQPQISNQINWVHSYSDAVAQANAKQQSIVILFTGTSWCPACMKLEREVLTRPEFARGVNHRFVFLKAEFPDYSEERISASPYRNLMQKYNVQAFPTFIVINPNGQQLDTVNYQAGGPQSYIQALLKGR